MIYRHGDIYLVPAKAPASATVRPANQDGHVIQEGEVTGHAHRLTNPDVTLVTDGEADELRMWVLLDSPSELVHEEHGTLTIPPGEYEVRRAREYTPERSRWVAD